MKPRHPEKVKNTISPLKKVAIPVTTPQGVIPSSKACSIASLNPGNLTGFEVILSE